MVSLISTTFSRFTHVSECLILHSFYCQIMFHGGNIPHFVSLALVKEHEGCFYFGTVANNTSRNNHISYQCSPFIFLDGQLPVEL